MRKALHGTLLLLLTGAIPALGQESGALADERAGEIEALEPGVSSAALAADAADDRQAEPAAAEPDALVAGEYRRRATTSGVMDEIDLGRTEITGNQELPKVLYIVPWRKSDPGDLTGKPINTLLDEVLAPIDRSEFIREVDYYDDLHRSKE